VVVDALQVHRRDAEIGVTDLTLDDVERYAFARHFNGMSVAELMRREGTPDARPGSQAAKLCSRGSVGPRSSARCAADYAEQRANWQGDAGFDPRM
jgi:hypothetical protein